VSDPLVLSASSVQTFIKCGQAWYYAYVAGIKAPPRLKATRGIAVHRAIETNMVQKIMSKEDLPVQDVVDAFDTSWNAEVANGYDKGNDDPGAIKDAGVKLVRLYHREVSPLIQPVIVEQPIQFKINGQAFSGQIDLGEEVPINLHGEPDFRLRLRDTKTTARAPQPENYLFNMTGYAIGARQALGETEADTVFDYLVATSKPYYKEIKYGGPITDDQIRRFSGTVASVADAINKGSFVPNGPVSGMCRYCGYYKMCPVRLEGAQPEGEPA